MRNLRYGGDGREKTERSEGTARVTLTVKFKVNILNMEVQDLRIVERNFGKAELYIGNTLHVANKPLWFERKTPDAQPLFEPKALRVTDSNLQGCC